MRERRREHEWVARVCALFLHRMEGVAKNG
jgi:hypothetical protein